MTTLKTTSFDAAKHVRSPEDRSDLLNDALASGNAGYIANALGIIARARGMSEVARGAGITREALYKALSQKGDPRLTTLLGTLTTLGFRLSAQRTMQANERPRKRGTKAPANAKPTSGRRDMVATEHQ